MATLMAEWRTVLGKAGGLSRRGRSDRESCG